MSNPSAAILVIGDEILSGRTRDSNLHYLSCELTKIGIDLQEARIIPDNATEIIYAVKWLSSKYNYLFTSGGIGPTHDDITADCIAAAFETEINIREDAFKLLESYYLTQNIDFNNLYTFFVFYWSGVFKFTFSTRQNPKFWFRKYIRECRALFR